MADPITAADTAQVTLAGASVTLVVAALGYLGTRKTRPEASALLVDSAVKLAQAAAAENDDLRAMVADLSAKVDRLRAAVEACEQKHAKATAALAAAGIVVPD